MIAGMSDKTADVLMGSGPVMEAGELARVLRTTDTQLGAGFFGKSRADLLAEIERTMHALDTYPTTPVLPDVELSIPMPRWADL
jgi:hypothetical protein